ncbi:MAG: 50S ribosomal protein L10 [Deltaproteobacteria bacterium]|nr:50S ribosomal protein L10 [Deltaproteobacteria bacterium]
MNKEQKATEIASIRERFQTSKAVIFAENKGLKVSEMTELRKKLHGVDAKLQVVKNRLVKRALKEAALEGLDGFFEGPTAIASATTDPVGPAKVLVDFAKDHEALLIKGGMMDKVALSMDKIKALAALPSKEQLYAKLLGCMLNPARGVVNVLAAMPRQLVTVIDAIGKQKTN